MVDDRHVLERFRISNARRALDAGDPAAASEWLAGVGAAHRPKDLTAAIEYELAKIALAGLRWREAERHLAVAATEKRDQLHQRRLGLLRARVPLMVDHAWEVLARKVAPAERLLPSLLVPDVAAVWACGAYYSRGRESGAPWSRFLRMAKEPQGDDHDASLSLAASYLCRWVVERTGLLREIDLVVPVPANPIRYGRRMMSLPDELARAVESQLAIPMAFDALRYTGTDLELRGLSWHERRRVVAGSMAVGKSGLVPGRKILVVDDVITSGATLGEAGRLLRRAGGAEVFAVCLAHTEG